MKKKRKHQWGWGIRTTSAKQLSFYNTKPMCVCVASAGGAVPPCSMVWASADGGGPAERKLSQLVGHFMINKPYICFQATLV